MLTCSVHSGCRVARFCIADHLKMASKKAALGGNLWTGRHKDICGVPPQVARCGQRRCGAGLVHCGAGGVSASRECAMPQGRRGSARGSSLITEVQGVVLQNEAAKVF
jgi:hypothetical protein